MLNLKKSLFLSLAIASLASLATVAVEGDARACGGCFVPPGPSTQVTAHRMAFAISATRTILWDQIQYTGSPEEFGWVLPIRGKVDVGVSSDQLFQRLENQTTVQIVGPPTPVCPRANRSTFGGAAQDEASAAPNESMDSGVSVWDQKVVGPYEATQLSATDGTALTNWLTDHAYVLPPAVAPVIDQYIKEGFGFLVVKLVPQREVTKMEPIRISFEGSSPSLPLRMIAAGTGAKVGLKLFVIGDGRWEAKNFPNAQIADNDLTWDFAAMGANYNQVFISKLAENGGRTWVTEMSDEIARTQLFSGLPTGTTENDAGATVFAKDTDETEIERAFPGKANVHVTRLFAELPQSALGTDLELQASTAGKLTRTRNVTNTKNHPCPGSTEGGSVFGCNATGSGSSMTWFVVLGTALGLSVVARRRR
jgi:hypothetical protein